MWKERIISVVITTFLFLSAVSFITIDKAEGSNGTTFYVGGSGPGNYTSIQSAIDDANNGDTVFVYNGVYMDVVHVNKAIKLLGEDKNSTIIKVWDSRAVIISSSWASVSGFNITAYGGSSDGIYLYEPSGIIITNNIITSAENGIHIFNSNNNIITDNLVTSNGWGILLSFSSSNNIITNNTFTNNFYGIILYSSNSNNTIMNNTFSDNAQGISLGYGSISNSIKDNSILNSDYGIILESSSGNIITNNTISLNNYDGIKFFSSNDNTIMCNTVSLNNDHGIEFYSSSGNKIYHNNFIDNHIHVAFHGGTNIWDDGYPSGGNYWDDYIGVDVNGDYIGDTPYFIGGDDKDMYPLIMPYNSTLNQSPTCILSANSTSGQAPLTVTFIMTANDPDGTIMSWKLDIDNDDTPDYSGSGTPPSTQQHIYQNIGAYTANLTVTDDDGETASSTVTITVSAETNQVPLAGYTYSPQNPTIQDIILFMDTSTDSDGEIVNWSWDFADGNTSYLQNPTHQYTSGGTYHVTLQVKDDDGLVNISSRELIVTSQEYNQYNLTVDIQPVNGGIVTLNPLGGVYGEGTLVTATAIASIGYEFSYWSGNASGTNLSVQIMMDSNKTITAHFEETNMPPNANFIYTIDELAVTFTHISADDDGVITNWYWNFGDGISSTVANPTHTYDEGGSYTVTLTVTDNDGDTDTYSKIITVTAEDNGTPGFELSLLIIVLISLVMIAGKKR